MKNYVLSVTRAENLKTPKHYLEIVISITNQHGTPECASSPRCFSCALNLEKLNTGLKDSRPIGAVRAALPNLAIKMANTENC